MKSKILLFILLFFDGVLLLHQTSSLSISYKEALFIENQTKLLSHIIQISFNFFGKNDFALRVPIIIIHLLSTLLVYLTSKPYLKDENSRLWLVFIFILLPGVMSSALIISNASLLIFGLFFFLYIYQKFSLLYTYPLLLLYALSVEDFIYLFFALFFYGIYKKDKKCIVANLLFITLSIYRFGFIIKGVPSGHFLDILGIYSAIFSPIIFLYLFYILYRKYLQKEIDIVWFISTFVLLYSIILSFRQKIYIEHYAPYVILALPLAAQKFRFSYKVRLKMFRKGYRNIFLFTIFLLIIHSIILIQNKELYHFLQNPKKHFAYNMHIAKELAQNLKKHHIQCIKTNKKMALRLKFYGIDSCSTYQLLPQKIKNPLFDVKISYNNVLVFHQYVTKINKKTISLH
ncbi:membrane protein [hydrothermal vent metagenome]|uniref:Membrane protein n=1 Tax=hydrothermal vent metagenome TaxID=652676 RepID=A0A1W1D1Q6_9ZZZZ